MFRCPPFGHPLLFGCPLYVWLSPVCLDAPQMYGESKGMRDIQTYVGVQTYRGIQMYGGIWTHPQPDKACFLFVVYVQQASKHLSNIHRGIQTYGSVQTYRKHPNIGVPKLTEGYPNIGESKHTGVHPNIWGIQIYGGVQTYRGIQT